RALDEEILEIRAVHDAMIRLYEARDRLPYFKLHQQIHSAILRVSRNQALADMHGILQARLKRIRYIGNESPDRWAGAVADLEEIIVALEKRDGEKLSAALEAHMAAIWERVRNSI